MTQTLHLDTFVPHLGSQFLLKLDAERQVALELSAAEDMGSTDHQEQFHVLLQGPADLLLPQGTYTLEHQVLGAVALFLVPIARTPEGFRYEAVFNRLVRRA